jgi:hypothetical protein
MIEPSPLGIPQMVFILAVLGCALWKEGWLRLIFSICLVIWGIFAIPYDIKIGIPLLALAVMLLVSSILSRIRESRSPVDRS